MEAVEFIGMFLLGILFFVVICNRIYIRTPRHLNMVKLVEKFMPVLWEDIRKAVGEGQA